MILSERTSKKIVSIMVTNNQIDYNLSEAYEYCIDFALDLIFFNLSLLIAGFITHNFILSVIYVFMLVPVKMLAGGADRIRSKHCCTLLLVIIFILLIIMVSFHLYRYCNMIMLCSIIIFANQIIGHLQLHFHKEGPL